MSDINESKTYTYKAKDGTLITGIPKDIDKTDSRLYERYLQLKAGKQKTGPFTAYVLEDKIAGVPYKSNVPAPASTPQVAPAPSVGQKEETPRGYTFNDYLKQLPHDAGAAGRGIVQGLTAAPGMVTDMLTSLVNLALPEDLKASSWNESVNWLMTKLGIPQAETKAQKLLQASSSGLFSGGGSFLAGKAIDVSNKALQAAPGAISALSQTMQAAPIAQALSGAGAETSVELARQKGASPLLQMGAGLAGGMIGGSIGGIKAPGEIIQSDDQIGAVIQKAAKGNKPAQKAIAEIASINPESVESAKRLGINLPVDVFSDNEQIRAAAGLGRSVAGGQAESQWRDTVKAAVDRADQIMQEAGATFSDGSAAPAVTSARVRDNMISTKAGLSKQATQMYNEIDAAVPKTAPASFGKLKETLNSITDEVGESGLSSQEKKLRDMIADPNATYGRLIREKNQIGAAISKKASPYGDMETGALKRLYGAMAEDQLETVNILGNPELKEQLLSANIIYGKERELGKKIINAFGKDQAGSIADKMRMAITSSAKGDTGAYTRLLDSIPEDLRKDVISTAIASVAKSGKGSESGGFGFSEFAKIYKGIRSNPEVYKSIVENLGAESDKVLRDLYEVSRRITDARANVLQTGKANQAYLQGMVSENFLQKILGTPIGKNITMLAGTAAGAAAAGPFGAAAGSGLSSSFLESIAQSDKKTAAMVGDLFRDPKFQGLMTKLSTGLKVGEKEVQDIAASKAFSTFLKNKWIESSSKAGWIMNAIRASQPKDNPEEQKEAKRANER